jgi:hypothetical protein
MALSPKRAVLPTKWMSGVELGQKYPVLPNVFEHPALETAESHNYTALTVF